MTHKPTTKNDYGDVTITIPCARAYRINPFSFPVAAATKIPLDTISFDNSGGMDVTVNNRYNILVPGYYRIVATLRWLYGNSGVVMIYKNGIELSQAQGFSPSPNYHSQASINDTTPCNAGDYIELWIQADTGTLVVAVPNPPPATNYLAISRLD